MKTYKMLGTSKGGVIPVSRKGGEWVPADVAQGLYDALRDMVSSYEALGASLPLSREVEMAMDALAAADGEAQ